MHIVIMVVGGGISRTIKANYYKVSRSNFVLTTARGATGVIEYEEEYDNICWND